jgi:hypothetical protein
MLPMWGKGALGSPTLQGQLYIRPEANEVLTAFWSAENIAALRDDHGALFSYLAGL